MGYKRVFCPGCGANVELDDSREFGFCRYCGAQIALDKVIVEHRGTVNINGIADTSALLERAKMHLEVNRYADALQCCDRSLDIDPRNSEAYVLKLMSETHSTSRDMLGKSIKPLEKYDSYKKAMRFASPEVQKELSDYNQQSFAQFQAETNRRIAELEQVGKDLNLQYKELDERRNRAEETRFWIRMHTFFVIVVVVLSILFEIGMKDGGGVGILLIVVGVLLLRLFRRRAMNNESSAYNYSNTVQESESFYEQSKKEFDDWMREMNSDC